MVKIEPCHRCYVTSKQKAFSMQMLSEIKLGPNPEQNWNYLLGKAMRHTNKSSYSKTFTLALYTNQLVNIQPVAVKSLSDQWGRRPPSHAVLCFSMETSQQRVSHPSGFLSLSQPETEREKYFLACMERSAHFDGLTLRGKHMQGNKTWSNGRKGMLLMWLEDTQSGHKKCQWVLKYQTQAKHMKEMDSFMP